MSTTNLPWGSRVGWRLAILVGATAVGLTLAVAELLAALGARLGLVDSAASPFDSLGRAFIAITPEWLQSAGISLFGQHDKVALAVGMLVTFVIVAAIIGLVGRLSSVGAVGLSAALVAVTGAAVVTRPAATVADLLPLLLGAVSGIGYLLHVLRWAPDPPAASRAWAPNGGGPTGVGDATAMAGPPGADDVTGAGTGSRRPAAPKPDGPPSPSGGAGRGAPATDEASRPPHVPADPFRELTRRGVLRATGIGALVAVAAAASSRLVPSVANVRADRAAVRLPPVTDPATSAAAAGSAEPSGAARATGTPAAASIGAGASSAAGSRVGASPALPALPNSVNPDVPGLTPFVTADSSFYRVDTAFTLPRVTTEAWRLRVHGLVDHPFQVTWDDLLAMPQVQRWLTLACVSNEVGGNLVGNAAWQGVRIADLLARARPQAGADCVLSTSVDNFTVTTPLDALTDGRDALLAFGMNGEPLPIEHGFPVRMVVPGLYGYVSATKWVVDLEVTRFADATAYWTRRGWAPRGPVKTSSRIDTPGYDVTVGPGVVPVAGVAWAQHRGVSGVQVQVDDGPWQGAALAGTVSKDTWRQWVFRWDTAKAPSGVRTLRCRAIDGTGAVQDGTPRPEAPDGVTGYHAVRVVVR